MFSRKINLDVLKYFYNEHLDKYFNKEELKNIEFKYKYIDPNFSVNPNNTIPFPIDLNDLVRLHKIIRKRKVFTILEYGIGYSTITKSTKFIFIKKILKNSLIQLKII